VCDMLIRFPLQGVHRFESPRLLNMSNHLSCGCQHVDDYGFLINVDLMGLIHYNTCFPTLVWLSLGLLCLKSNELSYMVKMMKVRTHL
jgi:hypothetical protein